MAKLVSYYNSGAMALDTAVNLPYTHIILAFLYTEADDPLSLCIGGGVAATTKPPTLTQSAISAIADLQSNGQKVLISFGGSRMASSAYEGIAGSEEQLAASIADFIKTNNLDGIDIDFEDSYAFMGEAGYDGVSFLVALTNALRNELPEGTYSITHAPQPPYLDVNYSMDGYVAIMEQAGDAIDWLNVQFYNNDPWSGNPSEIISAYDQFSQLEGLSKEKLLIGLPVTSHDAGSGYIPVDEIVSDIIDPIQNEGVLGGMMNWQFSSDTDGSWATTIGNALNQEDIS